MGFRLAADAVLVLHLGFIAFALAGALLCGRWPWLAWLHLPAVVWGVWIELSGGVCPLTPVENALRRAAGDEGYPGGFVEHYLLAILYPDGLTPGTQLVLAAILLGVNAVAYAWLVWRRQRKDGSGTGSVPRAEPNPTPRDVNPSAGEDANPH